MSLEDSAAWQRITDVEPLDDAARAAAFFGSVTTDIAPAIDHLIEVRAAEATASADEWLIRLFDVIFATAVLIAVSPALLLLIIALQIDSPGPIFFVQQRVGRDGALFPCIKLRTMVVDARERLRDLLESSPVARAQWEAEHKLKNDPRVTKLGRFARLFSLDELPQLVNILAGHMSVVGPRPIVDEEVWRYGSYFADYCSVRPGLTGLWQVSGRNNTTYEKRVLLDSQYARQKSLRFDVGILLRTFAVVIFARGAY
jgi:lipopolysaccharide/colanic/teichoic acid biosynthesis glycosyltransferase